MACDAGGRRNAHAFDAQACHLVELTTRAAKPTVGRPRVRAERAPADCASVAPSSARLRRKRAVAHDVEGPVFHGCRTRAWRTPSRRSRSLLKCTGGEPVVSSTISEVKLTDPQRPAQAPEFLRIRHPQAESNCRHHDFQSREMSASSDFSMSLASTTQGHVIAIADKLGPMKLRSRSAQHSRHRRVTAQAVRTSLRPWFGTATSSQIWEQTWESYRVTYVKSL